MNDTIDRHSAAPMYDQLGRLIIEGISRDGPQPGDPLPGDDDGGTSCAGTVR
ncbi:hypothetical protein AB0O14_16890 [Microbacterium foliorum]